jgi:hypothetical protein
MNKCSQHLMLEVTPGAWHKDAFIVTGVTTAVTFQEAACPICLTLARESLNYLMAHRTVILSTPAALEPA